MRSGMTLMSVMVAVALAGIVALAVARLLGNQSKTMAVVRLREQREELLKHYKNIVISGWDATRDSCSAAICDRGGNAIIPTGGLYLSDDLYAYNNSGSSGQWWKVTANQVAASSGSVLQADSYAIPESLIAVEVAVEFIRKEHPVVNTKLADRQEIVFLHHNTSGALPNSNYTQCESGHLTQLDSAGSALYSGTGAIIQYDFNSNYTKCSQVPLIVDSDACPNDSEATLGFFRNNVTDQLIAGSAICSIASKTNVLAGIRNNAEKRTVEAIDCSDEGYIEWMKDNEKPRCVTLSGGESDDDFRVAAESRPINYDYMNYTVTCLVESGCTSWHDPNDVILRRAVGIHAFNRSGPSGEISFTVPWGPPGPPGPPGPTGRRGCPGPNQPCTYEINCNP